MLTTLMVYILAAGMNLTQNCTMNMKSNFAQIAGERLMINDQCSASGCARWFFFSPPKPLTLCNIIFSLSHCRQPP